MSEKSTFYMGRRGFLKNLSIAGLAFSPLVLASRALANSTGQPRLLIISLAHGPGGKGMATGTETNFTPSAWLSPLTPLKQHLTLVDGVSSTWWGNAHDVSYSHVLTASTKGGSPSFTRPRAPSIDVILEEAFNKKKQATLPVMRLCVNKWGSGNSGAKSFCYNKRFEPLPFLDAYQANATLLNNIAGGTPTKPNPLVLKQKRLLDELNKDLKSLRGRIGPAERNKLDAHLDAIVATNANLGLNKQQQATAACTKPTALTRHKGGNYPAYGDTLDRQLAHARALFTCGLSQIAVIDAQQIPDDIYDWYDEKGKKHRGKPCITDDFHQCVAHYKTTDQRRCFEGSVRFFMTKIAAFAQSLDKIKESNGKTLLENTIIVVTGEVGDGSHERKEKPYVLIGGRGAPKLRTGRHIKVPTYNPDKLVTPDGTFSLYKKAWSTRTEADLWREVALAMGVPLKTVGSPYLNKGKIGLM